MATGSKKPLGIKTAVLNERNRMKQLNLDRINAKAPYKVSIDGKQLVFETQYGLRYKILFLLP